MAFAAVLSITAIIPGRFAGNSATDPPNRTANKSSVMVARITFRPNTNSIPAAKLRQVLCSLLCRACGARGMGNANRKNIVEVIASIA